MSRQLRSLEWILKGQPAATTAAFPNPSEEGWGGKQETCTQICRWRSIFGEACKCGEVCMHTHLYPYVQAGPAVPRLPLVPAGSGNGEGPVG